MPAVGKLPVHRSEAEPNLHSNAQSTAQCSFVLMHPHRQVRKSVKLKLLTRIEAFVDSPGQQEYFELAFAQVRSNLQARFRCDFC